MAPRLSRRDTRSRWRLAGRRRGVVVGACLGWARRRLAIVQVVARLGLEQLGRLEHRRAGAAERLASGDEYTAIAQ